MFRLIVAIFWLMTPAVYCAKLTQVLNFGNNPTNIDMYIYVPAKLAPSPAVIVAMHLCGGSAEVYYSSTKYPQLAEEKGFIVIYPGTTHDNNCWDVATTKSLSHNGGGDSEGIVEMVNYTISTYNANPAKVFVTGSSSGGMMTNVLAATYPEVFAAGAVFSGVAAGCLAGSPSSSPQSADPACASGRVIHTAQEWGDIARACYAGYNGTRPRMQIWHGTADTVVRYANLGEQIKQWSNVLGVAFSKNSTNDPLSGYTKMIYSNGTEFTAYSAVGVGHPVPVRENDVLSFFGLE